MKASFLRAVSIFLLCTCCATPLPAEPLTIGALFSLSGWGAKTGQDELNAVLMSVEDVNAGGGINGTRLVVAAEDNGSDLKRTSAALHKLRSEDRAVAIVGPNYTEFAAVAAPLAHRLRVPQVAASANSPDVIQHDTFFFTLWPSHAVTVRPLVEEIARQGVRKLEAAVSENSYQEALFEAARPMLERKGIAVAPPEHFPQGTSDFRSFLARVRQKNRDVPVLAFIAEGGDAFAFFKQRRELSIPNQIFSTNTPFFEPPLLAEPSLVDGVVLFKVTVAGSSAFLERYRNRFHTDAGFSAARAYDAVQAVARSMKECGISSAEIARCLKTVRFKGESGTIAFDDHGVIAESGDVSVVVKGIAGH